MRNCYCFVGVLTLLTVGFTACQQPSVEPPVPQASGDSAVSRLARRLGLNGTRLASGLYFALDTAKPTGKLAQANEELEFTYRSYDTLNRTVDSTVAGFPVYYVLGLGALVKGLDQGLALMREGETATLLLPYYLGYGEQAKTGLKTTLPAYSVVGFDVHLRRSRTEGQQIADYLALNKLTSVDTTANGLRIIRPANNPTGVKPTTGQTLNYAYSAYLLRAANPFESSPGASQSPGVGSVVTTPGFQQGLDSLRVGQQATFIFPSNLGYGATGLKNSDGTYRVTPYTPVRVTIQLISAR